MFVPVSCSQDGHQWASLCALTGGLGARGVCRAGLLGRTHGALCVMGTPGRGAQAKPTQLLFSTLLGTSLPF